MLGHYVSVNCKSVTRRWILGNCIEDKCFIWNYTSLLIPETLNIAKVREHRKRRNPYHIFTSEYSHFILQTKFCALYFFPTSSMTHLHCFSVLMSMLSFLTPQNVYVNNILGSKHAIMWPVSHFSLQYKIWVLKCHTVWSCRSLCYQCFRNHTFYKSAPLAVKEE
jgi:hypothetical protein